MKRKIVSITLSLVLGLSLIACGGEEQKTQDNTKEETALTTQDNTKEGTETASENVKITILNTKDELQSQWEEVAELYYEQTGVEVEVAITVVDSPSEDITKRYASGEVPTIFMGDVQDIVMLDEYALDLSNEEWVTIGGKQFGCSINEKVKGFPFCIEARGLMYNKTAIEQVIGETFDPKQIKSQDDLKVLLDRLVEGGMEKPVALNMEDWSLAGHYLTQLYEEQDGTAAGAQGFVDGIKAGTLTLADNARWNSLMDTFDLLMQYNMYREEPLAADYDGSGISLAEGEIAFWFNGNWAWAEMAEFADENSEYGIMPIPQNDNTNQAAEKLCGGATKYLMIDTKYNDEKQQQAAKDFLNWLVYNEAGWDFMVNRCNLVPAFSNIELEVTNPIGISVQKYTAEGNIFETFSGLPGDHWEVLGAEMQKYLDAKISREELESKIEDYWKKQ